MWRGLWPLLLLLLSAAGKGDTNSPPGKPVLVGCRSPEKETFTCWWEPGSDGGLPTTHRLFYERENLEGMFECPDYISAGRNSCYFDKNHTAIWYNYYLTVVATNSVGNASSDPFKMDVMEIVKPNPPENVTLQLEETKDQFCLHVRWERPDNIDTKSGWVTFKYELRVKQENSDKWREYKSGTQHHFSLYSVTPGVTYMVQVRCRLDHSSWSEWTNTTSVKIPNSDRNDGPFWILVSVLSAIPFLAVVGILVMKRKHVKQYVLPPVPGPKIIGLDVQLLKSGRSEDVINALIMNQNFPLMAGWKDQMEDYLIVTENDSRLLPDTSSPEKWKKSLIIPNSDIKCNESTASQNDWKERRAETDKSVKSSKPLSVERLSNEETLLPPACPSINFVNTEVTHQGLSDLRITVEPLENSSYVDIQRHVTQVDYSRVKEVKGDNIVILADGCGCPDVQRTEENISDDYSRVKEVDGDNNIFLQKQNVSLATSCSETDNCYTDFTPQKPKTPHVVSPHKAGLCAELINGGYVDNIPAPPLM